MNRSRHLETVCMHAECFTDAYSKRMRIFAEQETDSTEVHLNPHIQTTPNHLTTPLSRIYYCLADKPLSQKTRISNLY